MVLVAVFPLIYLIVVSFQRISLSDDITSFSGLVNYARIFSDARLWDAVLHTLLITVIALPIELVLGMLLGYHFLPDRPFKRLLVALLIIPSVISPMVAGSMWRLMFDHRFGPVNQMISAFTEKPVVLLWVVKGSLPFWSIVVAEVWQWTPFMFIILLAAIANVDRDQMQAAALDGAHRRHVFWYVVLPAIRPVLIIAVLIRALDLFRLFDVVWQLTKGGPGNRTETISVYMYIQGFQGFQTSYVAAIVVVLAIVLSSVLMLALRRVRLDR